MAKKRRVIPTDMERVVIYLINKKIRESTEDNVVLVPGDLKKTLVSILRDYTSRQKMFEKLEIRYNNKEILMVYASNKTTLQSQIGHIIIGYDDHGVRRIRERSVYGPTSKYVVSKPIVEMIRSGRDVTNLDMIKTKYGELPNPRREDLEKLLFHSIENDLINGKLDFNATEISRKSKTILSDRDERNRLAGRYGFNSIDMKRIDSFVEGGRYTNFVKSTMEKYVAAGAFIKGSYEGSYVTDLDRREAMIAEKMLSYPKPSAPEQV